MGKRATYLGVFCAGVWFGYLFLVMAISMKFSLSGLASFLWFLPIVLTMAAGVWLLWRERKSSGSRRHSSTCSVCDRAILVKRPKRSGGSRFCPSCLDQVMEGRTARRILTFLFWDYAVLVVIATALMGTATAMLLYLPTGRIEADPVTRIEGKCVSKIIYRTSRGWRRRPRYGKSTIVIQCDTDVSRVRLEVTRLMESALKPLQAGDSFYALATESGSIHELGIDEGRLFSVADLKVAYERNECETAVMVLLASFVTPFIFYRKLRSAGRAINVARNHWLKPW